MDVVEEMIDKKLNVIKDCFSKFKKHNVPEFLELYFNSYSALKPDDKIYLLKSILDWLLIMRKDSSYYAYGYFHTYRIIEDEVNELLLMEKIGYYPLIESIFQEDRKELSKIFFCKKQEKFDKDFEEYKNLIIKEYLLLFKENKRIFTCPIGLEEIKNLAILPCFHFFEENNIIFMQNNNCPLCRDTFNYYHTKDEMSRKFEVASSYKKESHGNIDVYTYNLESYEEDYDLDDTSDLTDSTEDD